MAYPLLTNQSWRLSRALILLGAEYPLLVYVCREQKTFLWQLLWKIRTKGRERNEQQHNNTERLKSEWRYRQTVRDKKGINACEVMREGRVPDGAPEKNPVNCQWEMEALLEKIFSLIFFRLKTGILCHQEAVCKQESKGNLSQWSYPLICISLLEQMPTLKNQVAIELTAWLPVMFPGTIKKKKFQRCKKERLFNNFCSFDRDKYVKKDICHSLA